MSNYVFRRNKEGIFYINLAKTWEKLMVAARIIAAVQHKNPKDVLVSNHHVLQTDDLHTLLARWFSEARPFERS